MDDSREANVYISVKKQVNMLKWPKINSGKNELNMYPTIHFLQ